MNFFKWTFTRWFFWLVVAILTIINLTTGSRYYGFLASLFAAVIYSVVIFFVIWLISKFFKRFSKKKNR